MRELCRANCPHKLDSNFEMRGVLRTVPDLAGAPLQQLARGQEPIDSLI